MSEGLKSTHKANTLVIFLRFADRASQYIYLTN